MLEPEFVCPSKDIDEMGSHLMRKTKRALNPGASSLEFKPRQTDWDIQPKRVQDSKSNLEMNFQKKNERERERKGT